MYVTDPNNKPKLHVPLTRDEHTCTWFHGPYQIELEVKREYYQSHDDPNTTFDGVSYQLCVHENSIPLNTEFEINLLQDDERSDLSQRRCICTTITHGKIVKGNSESFSVPSPPPGHEYEIVIHTGSHD